MFFFHRIWNWCSRFRHRRGYGVHSPSDFFLITSVVYEKYHYYAYRKGDFLLICHIIEGK